MIRDISCEVLRAGCEDQGVYLIGINHILNSAFYFARIITTSHWKLPFSELKQEVEMEWVLEAVSSSEHNKKLSTYHIKVESQGT